MRAKGSKHQKPPQTKRMKRAKGGKAFPDLSGDGKVTKKDVLMGRGVIRRPGKKTPSKKPKGRLK